MRKVSIVGQLEGNEQKVIPDDVDLELINNFTKEEYPEVYGMGFATKLEVILDTSIETGRVLLMKDQIYVNPDLAQVIGDGAIEFVSVTKAENLTAFGKLIHQELLKKAKKEVERLETILTGA